MKNIDIQVSPDDFVRTHDGLVRMLYAIERAGLGGVTTRVICDSVFNSRGEGMKIIGEAEKAGYIHRFKLPTGKRVKNSNSNRRKKRRGRYYVMNALTRQGRQLLAKLQTP